MDKDLTTAVLYNSQCPVCNVEVGHYARYAIEAHLPIRFDDLERISTGLNRKGIPTARDF